jgi:hypothetical protein
LTNALKPLEDEFVTKRKEDIGNEFFEDLEDVDIVELLD